MNWRLANPLIARHLSNVNSRTALAYQIYSVGTTVLAVSNYQATRHVLFVRYIVMEHHLSIIDNCQRRLPCFRRAEHAIPYSPAEGGGFNVTITRVTTRRVRHTNVRDNNRLESR